jgi:hypothetical protein
LFCFKIGGFERLKIARLAFEHQFLGIPSLEFSRKQSQQREPMSPVSRKQSQQREPMPPVSGKDSH